MAAEQLPEEQVELDRTPTPKEEAEGTFQSLDDQRKSAETQGVREANRDLRYNRLLRARYARWVFCYLISYSIFVAVVLVGVGFGVCGFTLPERVLEFLVGSTAASAIGLVFAVTNGLFKIHK